nr:BTB/POZ domain-containing protein At3g05675-like [Coffea arabica]
MDLMKDFVGNCVDISDNILVVLEGCVYGGKLSQLCTLIRLSTIEATVVENKKFDSAFWGLKVKLIEVTAKVLKVVGYGNVILLAQCRVYLLKTRLPYTRKIKPLLDSMADKETEFPFKLDEHLCQSIERAMVSLILALPSSDQADILVNWMSSVQLRYPNLSEAFEVWCCRTKSAKRRLVEGLNNVGNTAVCL